MSAWGTRTQRAALSTLSLKNGTSTPAWTSTHGVQSKISTAKEERRLPRHSFQRRLARAAASPGEGSLSASGRGGLGEGSLRLTPARRFCRRSFSMYLRTFS